MYLCHLDESGTTHTSDQSKTFVYASLAVPIHFWKEADQQILNIKHKYDIGNAEIHTAWILRKYIEQIRITNFKELSYSERRVAFLKEQDSNLRVWTINKTQKQINSKKKHYRMIFPYIHLTLEERREMIVDIATIVGGWTECRLFCDAIKKEKYRPGISRHDDMYEEAFEQIVTRLETFLKKISPHHKPRQKHHALLIADNHKEKDKKLTALMRDFYSDGTFWRNVNHIVETPLFVDSKLTSLVQVADDDKNTNFGIMSFYRLIRLESHAKADEPTPLPA